MENPQGTSPRRGYLADSLAFNLLPRKDYLKEYREKYGKKSTLGENSATPAGSGTATSAGPGVTTSSDKTCELIAKYLKKDYPLLFRKDALKSDYSDDNSINVSPNSRTAAVLTNPGIVRYLGGSANGERISPRQLSRSRQLSSSVTDLSKPAWNDQSSSTQCDEDGQSTHWSSHIPTFDEFKLMKKSDQIGIFVGEADAIRNTSPPPASSNLRRVSSELCLLAKTNSPKENEAPFVSSYAQSSFETHAQTSNPTKPKIMTRCHSDVSADKYAKKTGSKKRRSIDGGDSSRTTGLPARAIEEIDDFGKTYVIEKPKKHRETSKQSRKSSSPIDSSREKREKSRRKRRETNDDVGETSSVGNQMPDDSEQNMHRSSRTRERKHKDGEKQQTGHKSKSRSDRIKERRRSRSVLAEEKKTAKSPPVTSTSCASISVCGSSDNSTSHAKSQLLDSSEIKKEAQTNPKDTTSSPEEITCQVQDSSEELLQERFRQHISMHSTREDILGYLDDLKRSGLLTVDDCSSVQSSEEWFDESLQLQGPKTGIRRHKSTNTSFASTSSTVSSCTGTHKQGGMKGTDIERVDSGVGSETRAKPHVRLNEVDSQGIVCEDCDKVIKTGGESVEDEHLLSYYVCPRCEAKRVERSEAIREIVDTELSYGRDLQIIREEFYIPIETAGLLTSEQMKTVFLNLDELITINSQFVDTLQDALDIAMDSGDEDLTTVSVGSLFLDYSTMLLAFENYCVHQSGVGAVLDQLQKEKELLRIFLYVSQTENSLLRRMNLKSFLMVPIQRVMKYPLLLSRLYKSTPAHHKDKEPVKESLHKIEHILEHINSKTGGSAGLRVKQRLSKKSKDVENLEIVKVALDALNWNRQESQVIISGPVRVCQPSDSTWVKKVKQMKWAHLHGLLVTLGKPDYYDVSKQMLVFPKSSRLQQGALVFVKEKAGKFTLFKEPVFLDKSLVSLNTDYSEAFELLSVGDDLSVIRCEEQAETDVWFSHLKHISLSLGRWKQRRSALANIMMKNKIHS